MIINGGIKRSGKILISGWWKGNTWPESWDWSVINHFKSFFREKMAPVYSKYAINSVYTVHADPSV